MAKTFIGVREVDEETFRKFRARAIEKKLKLGEALTLAMKNLMKEKEAEKNKPDPKNLLKISGIIKTKEKVRWSEEIDDILYG
jgi:hypothetical protein